jgi:sigma-B regulation protein RsbU (phosphoserine phosphatase)
MAETVMREQLADRRQRLVAATAFDESPYLGGLLREVDEALDRLDVGTFGLCDVCHDPVESERLLADPLVRLCVDHLTGEQRRALEHDLDSAAKIQAALLPESRLEAGGWQIHFEYRPLGPVSGDHCDLLPANGEDGPFYFLFGDVSGKGVAASILMSHLHALFRSLIELELPLADVVRRANRLFCESTLPSSYATLVAGRADPSGRVELCNAGHCPPLVVRAGEVAPLAATGLPLGLFHTGSFDVSELELGADDFLLLYTDGLSEARNPGGEEYGIGRVGFILQSLSGFSAEATLEACLDDLESFQDGAERGDDLTLMCLRRR